MVTAIIQLAHSIGMRVVCEGVETAQQHHEVTELGSDGCQGFYFARPMPAAHVAALIDTPAGGIVLHLPAGSADIKPTSSGAATPQKG